MAYSLGQLGYAVGVNSNDTTQTRLAADGRGSSTTTAMSDFTASITLSGTNTTIIKNAMMNAYISYTCGSLFMSRIRSQTRNFSSSWKFLVGTGSGDAKYAWNPPSAGGGGTASFGTCSILNDGPSGNYDETAWIAFFDHFNGYTSMSVSPYIDIWGS